MLTFKKRLGAETDPALRKALLAGKVEDMINTVVRQIAFYEFECRVHAARAEGELTPDQTHQVTYTAMPKFVTALLKTRLPSIKFCDRLNEFCQVLLRATVEMLNTSSHWELIECTARVLRPPQSARDSGLFSL